MVKQAGKVAGFLHCEVYQLTDKDIKQLAMSDSDYKLFTWEDLRDIIAENRLEALCRVPSELRRYLAWSNKARKEYGSIQAFMLKERLGWKDLNPKNTTLFACGADTKILVNDWPYGFAPGISHLVVWTKVPIPIVGEPDPGAGDITPEARKLISDFVEHTFSRHLGAENVLWFKNWAGLQSIPSMAHIHVLLNGASDEFIASIVGPQADGGERSERGKSLESWGELE